MVIKGNFDRLYPFANYLNFRYSYELMGIEECIDCQTCFIYSNSFIDLLGKWIVGIESNSWTTHALFL